MQSKEVEKNDYEFHNPGKIRTLSRISGEIQYASTNGSLWSWNDGGKICKISWEKYTFPKHLRSALCGFFAFRLKTKSTTTVANDIQILRILSKMKYDLESYPWTDRHVLWILNRLKHNSHYSFRAFYRWCVNKNIKGFDESILLTIDETNPIKRETYQSVLFRKENISASDEIKLLKHLEQTFDEKIWVSVRNNVLLHLGFELGPRPIQIYSLDYADFKAVESGENSYFSISLPMAKKRQANHFEKRYRSISQALGKKIKILINLNRKRNLKSNALFLDELGSRLSAHEIGNIVIEKIKILKFETQGGLYLLRKHLGQSLADQGAPVQIIAEILGHNSTVPAKAYVKSSPKISEIKTRALGKSKTYLKVIHMLQTGEFIDRHQSAEDSHVKGVVGSQYIGGIGSCRISSHTSCPKNPIYSCYTCANFHPFTDGNHLEVREALELQVQEFIDVVASDNEAARNRTLTQLELTIQSVNSIIEKCNIRKQN